VSTEEVLSEVFRATFGNHVNRNPGSIGSNQGTGFSQFVYTCENFLLNIQTLHNGFQDPIYIGDLFEVIIKVSGFDQASSSFVVKCCRATFDGTH